jgi:hypothetical protein
MVVLGLFVLVVCLPMIWRPAAPVEASPAPASEGADPLKLVVITSHNEQIRYEFARGFSAWHQRLHGRPVRIDWRFMGTGDMRRLLTSEYTALGAAGKFDEPAGYDVAFGGGDYEYDKKFKPGVKIPLGGGESRMLPITQPLDLDPAFVRQVFPSPMLADRKLHDPEGHWWGAVLSSFGIVFNRDALAIVGAPEPRTWSDLADWKYRGWVALADPSKSSSINTIYEAIVQRYGWERGWWTLRRVCANARYFAESSTKVPTDVGAGEAAAGMAIDFYGKYQAQVVGGGRVGFVAPADATVVNPDPIAVLHGLKGQRLEMARRFVVFVLSEEGQAIWCLSRGGPIGPDKYELMRPSVRPDMYARHSGRLVDRMNPFEIAKPLPPNTPSYFTVMPVVLHAMAIDLHHQLQDAWVEIHRTTDPAKRRALERLLDELPFTAEQLQAAPARWEADRRMMTADRLEWTTFFRSRYQRILAGG